MRRASRYEPDVNRTYHDLAVHYGTAVLPARPRSPQDKAKVEAAVQNVGRWVLAPLRNHRFFSLSEVREAIAPLLAALNERPFQKIEGSRRSLFEDLDRPALKPLPADRYEYAKWRKARVNIDYHIQVDGRFYSVPHALARWEVEVRLGTTTIEIFHKHRRVAAHLRSRGKGGYTTDPGHMPATHRAHLEWTPSRLVRWARKTGPETAAFARKLLETRRHPEQGYRSCLGLMRLARAYPAERMEAACRRALDIGAHSYKSVKTILSAGLDQANDGDQRALSLLLEREKTEREQRRYMRLKGLAKLHLDATIEDLNFKANRDLDRSLVLRLASGQWIKDGQTVLVTGATGSGKSYLACALGHQACRNGISTRYYRVSRLLVQLTLARADGSYPKLVQRLAKTWLLVLDDWGLASLFRSGPPRSARGPRRPLRPPRNHPRLPAPRRALARCRWRPHLRGRHPRQGPQQRPPDHPQGRFHEAVLRLDQGGPKPHRPRLIHPCSSTLSGSPLNPDGLARPAAQGDAGRGSVRRMRALRTGWPGRALARS